MTFIKKGSEGSKLNFRIGSLLKSLTNTEREIYMMLIVNDYLLHLELNDTSQVRIR